MPLFSRRIPYDRKRMLDRAEALAGSWRWRRALVLYRQVLAAEPHNAEIHGRSAPLLARTGRTVEAWESFQIALRAFEENGDSGSARKLERQAVKSLPTQPDAYRALARRELARGKPQEATGLLAVGSRRLTRVRRRGSAIVLLREARSIEAWNPKIVLALCRLLARDGQPAEALFLLDQLEERVDGEVLCAVRAQIWRIEPSLRHSWRWYRAYSERRAQRSRELNRPATSRS